MPDIKGEMLEEKKLEERYWYDWLGIVCGMIQGRCLDITLISGSETEERIFMQTEVWCYLEKHFKLARKHFNA